MPSLDPTTLDRLLIMMYNINPYVEMFKMARDMMGIEGAPMDLKLRLIASRTKDARRYNVPTANEVVALMVGDGSKVVDRHDVVIVQQASPFQRISELHVGYMALHYPLLFHCSLSYIGIYKNLQHKGARMKQPAPTCVHHEGWMASG
jgi:hypothetical protein